MTHTATDQDASLVHALATLGNPSRFAMLRELRTPKYLNEIVLRVGGEPDESGRPLARQTVREHLDRLLELGIVVARESERAHGPVVEYHLNHQTLFAIAEEFRGLVRLRPTAEPTAMTTRVETHEPQFTIKGPCLVLVKGLDEGRTFDLAPKGAARREWVIGRRRGTDVSLDFDPFVSAEHAAIAWEDGSHFVVDLPESTNGTSLNFQTLPKGARRALRTGDVVGVGHSLLLFRA